MVNGPAPLSAAARVEINGAAAGGDELREAALDDYGHFTAMQVRDRRTRGLDLHLARLDEAHQEMFGAPLDPAVVRGHIRHALGAGTADASVRVHVRERDGEPSVMVIVRPPAGWSGAALRLKSVPYQRSVAHLKHLGDFGQTYYRRQVLRDGYDEALLTGPDGEISEGSVTNVGFADASGVRWPSAPLLRGTTMGLLQRHGPSHGLPSRRAPVRLSDDLESFTAVFACSSRGLAPVSHIDDRPVRAAAAVMNTLTGVYDSAPWDPI